MKYDLVIAYRLYPGVSKQPFIYKDNKLTLAELGVASLKESLGDLKVKSYFLLDGCPEEYELMISKYFKAPETEFVRVDKIGNLRTFEMQIDLLSSQSDSEYVYFAEDDYLYKPNEFISMLNFLKNNPEKVDFVTCFDHLDYYTEPQHQYSRKTTFGEGKHWFSACSTCLTFLTTKSTLKETKHVFKSFCKGSYDLSLWMALTKFHIFNPFSYFKFLKRSLLTKSLVKVFFHSPIQAFFKKKRMLWVPITGIGTHMQFDTLSPNDDWKEIAAKIKIK